MRKRILLGVVTMLGLVGSVPAALAQQDHYKCGLPQRLREIYAADPQLEADQYNLMHQFREKRDVNGQTRDVFIVPIVFHIIHNYGTENISDQNIYDQMNILNEDFSATNSDLNQVVPAFDTVIGNPMIEFRLATIDPLGNCTNGIEHIYSNNANDADDYAKLNQWNRSKYLNVWIVESIGEAGVAGYAYYPSSTEGFLTFADGIIILYNYIGSLPPSSAYNSRALTHEIGHYLGLAHTWGSTNDPEVACGDDGIADTPVTAGHSSCTAQDLADGDCDTNIIENTQNYMEYSYCSRMFTEDQATFMRNTLQTETAQRSNLVTQANLEATGTATMPGVQCTPIADFSANFRYICEGGTVNFKDASWKAGVTSWSWEFPGGSPATSTSEDVTVTYSTPGWKTVTLTVTNAAGTSTITKNNYVLVSMNGGEFTGPLAQDFDNGPDFWISDNEPNSYGGFWKATGYGRNGTKGYGLRLYHPNPPAYYAERLGGSVDALISPAINLSNTTGTTVSFDYAYGTNATTLDEMTEVLRVYTSTDCGKNWNLVRTYQDTALLTAGYVGNTDFVPSATQWKTRVFNLNTTPASGKLRLKFEFTASDKSSNFYIDNININGVLALDEAGEISGMTISPNPVSSGSDLNIELETLSADMQLFIVDMSGKVVNSLTIPATNGASTVSVPMNVAKGCYTVTAVQGSSKATHRVIVM